MTLSGINQLWTADITYIRLETEFVYLAVVLDAFSRKVIGWAVDRTLEASLPLAALKMALAKRQFKLGLVHHSDRVLRARPRHSDVQGAACSGNAHSSRNFAKRERCVLDETILAQMKRAPETVIDHLFGEISSERLFSADRNWNRATRFIHVGTR